MNSKDYSRLFFASSRETTYFLLGDLGALGGSNLLAIAIVSQGGHGDVGKLSSSPPKAAGVTTPYAANPGTPSPLCPADSR
ncbi:MAG: hypothetical protein ABL996_13110, partial [Micropepsaceae bacterium]